MQVILKRPGECAKIGELTDYNSMHDFCEGCIESVPLFTPSGKRFLIVCNEEFLLNDSSFNMWLGGVQFFGNIFICALGFNDDGESDFVGLSNEDIDDIASLLDWSDLDRVSLLAPCICPTSRKE